MYYVAPSQKKCQGRKLFNREREREMCFPAPFFLSHAVSVPYALSLGSTRAVRPEPRRQREMPSFHARTHTDGRGGGSRQNKYTTSTDLDLDIIHIIT